jgi:AAA+ ATPase superfamily predicted ATPase
LDEDYNYVSKLQPMFSKPGSRNVRWCIEDCFLRFWFRFILPNQNLIEMERTEIDIIALNDIDRTALVAGVKRNATRYDARLLQEKFERIKGNFGKYKETKLIGLSMEDM